MTQSPRPESHDRLVAHLRQYIPWARLAATPLPQLPALRLWLMDELRPDQPLEPGIVNALMDAPPYWSLCWASGQVLADWLLRQPPEQWQGRTLVDVGSGSGVVAVAAALAGATRVIACDLDPQAHAAVALNAWENGVQVEVTDDLESCLAVADWVTAADILYDRDNLALLQRFREGARRPVVMLADSRIPDLNPDGYQRLLETRATTWPDLGESRDFSRVRLFRADPAP